MTSVALPIASRADDDVMAAEYALGLLSGHEKRAFEGRAQSEPALTEMVARWQEHFAKLADDLPVVPPRKRVWRDTAVLINGARSGPSLRHKISAIAGGVASACLIWALFFADVHAPAPGVPILTATLSPTSSAAQYDVSFDKATRALSLRRTGARPSKGYIHHVWLIAGQNDPVALGQLEGDGSTLLFIDSSLVDLMTGSILAVSEEPARATAGVAPEGPVVAVGALTGL